MFPMKTDELLFKQVEQWIKDGENDKVKLIVENTVPTDLVGKYETTLLHLAIEHRNWHMIEYSVSIGCDINAPGGNMRYTPLMLTILMGYWEATKFLLKNNASIFASNHNNECALKVLMRMANPDLNILQLFFDVVKNESTDKQEFVEILGEAGSNLQKIIHLHDVETTKIFLETYRADLNPIYVIASVRIAIESMDEENMNALIRAEIGTSDERGIYLLAHIAFMMENYKDDEPLPRIMQLAIELLTELKLLHKQSTYLMERLIYKAPSAIVLRKLLNDSLVSYIKIDFGYDIRVHMCGNKNPWVLGMIQQGEADICALGTDGRTALHIATNKGSINTMKYLLDCGLNPNIRDENGKTCIFNKFTELERLTLLLLYGADLQVYDNGGGTILDFYSSSMLNDKDKDTLKIVSAHLAILDSNGVSLTESFRDYIFKFDELRSHFRSCYQQLDKMKSHNVHSSLTLFESLAENFENLIRRVRSLDRDAIETFFNSRSVQEYDLYYISASKERLEKAVTIKDLRHKAMAVIGDSVEILESNYVVLDKICSYLTYYDLRVFAEPK